MHFTIKVADRIIAIDSRYDYIKEYCKGYCVSDIEADMHISVTEQEIEAERVMEEGYTFSSGYLETLAVLRKIGEQLAKANQILFHGVIYKRPRAISGIWKYPKMFANVLINYTHPVLLLNTWQLDKRHSVHY